MRWLRTLGLAALLAGAPATAQAPAAQVPAPKVIAPPIVQTPVEALAQDAAEYARLYGVSLVQALRELHMQEASVAATDRLAETYRDRQAGLFIEHAPAWRIVLLLTGTEPVADTSVDVDGTAVPVVFRTGAIATRAAIVAAIRDHQDAIRATVARPPGMGVDPRTGRMIVLVQRGDAGTDDGTALAARIEAIAGVPVEVRSWNDAASNLAVEGGSRVIGTDPANGRRYVCTSGFVVTDGTRTAITTAAHCLDQLDHVAPDRTATPLTMIGAWGARYQDVQIHVADVAMSPLFYADAARTVSRQPATWRARASTRAGDFVCHRGERTGYSCAEVLFPDFAPPGDLCAGDCEPSWVAVKGPTCRGGDSGGPVFLGAVAFGITKGASYLADGACALYYYMSVDYLPPGWTVAVAAVR